MVEDGIKKSISQALQILDVPSINFSLEHPSDRGHGDFSTNVALIASKELGKNPKEIAEAIVREMKKGKDDDVEKIEVAGPGFINFFLSRTFFTKSVGDIISNGQFGKTKQYEGKTVMVEYTDPNPFKEFHIGHMMSNAIGESIARLYEWNGAEVLRVSYQGDVGLHVAKTLWAMKKHEEDLKEDMPLPERVAFLGRMYVEGSKAYEENAEAKQEILSINKQVFDKTWDAKTKQLYEEGRAWSLELFDEIYKRLGTTFVRNFFESEVSEEGTKLVKEYLSKGVFEESEGAIIFPGEKHGLHNRVFINSQGLPTYEAKELGLTFKKFEEYNPDLSVVITANEQNDYFRVLIRVISLMNESYGERTKHVGHGVLRLPSGKMSSRTGDIVTADSLIKQVGEVIRSKMGDRPLEGVGKIIEDISVGALKFAILRQAPGKDVVFDFDTSLSFEGDSGPYLQYSAVRARSVLKKAEESGAIESTQNAPAEIFPLERLLYRLPGIIFRAGQGKSPQLLVTYLLELAAAFNSYYATTKIIDDSKESSYHLALTSAFYKTISNGLSALGIRVPSAM